MKKVYNNSFWNDFENGNIVIHCRTREESVEFFKVLIQNGISKWRGADKITTDLTRWEKYKEDTCYRYDSNGLAFADTYCYKAMNYNIVSFDKVLFSQISATREELLEILSS